LPVSTPLSSVLDVATKFGGAEYREAVEFLVSWSEAHPLLVNQPHTGMQSVWKYEVKLPAGTYLFWAVYPHQKKIDMHFTNLSRFADPSEREALRARLKAIPGLTKRHLPDETPTVLSLSTLATQEARQAFVDVMKWVLQEPAEECS